MKGSAEVLENSKSGPYMSLPILINIGVIASKCTAWFVSVRILEEEVFIA